MQQTIAELDRLTRLCDKLHFPVSDKHSRTSLLESLSDLIGADSAAFRSRSLQQGEPRPADVTSCGIAAEVDQAYREHFYRLDPMLKILPQLLAADTPPVPRHDRAFSAEANKSLILPPGERLAASSEYLRSIHLYRDQFLLPNKLCHHAGFLLRENKHKVWLFNFHRPPTARDFTALELARMKLISRILQQQLAKPPHTEAPDDLLISRLSPREHDVGMAVAQGETNKQIAATLGISVRTVENHLRNIYDKLAISSRTQLASRLYRH